MYDDSMLAISNVAAPVGVVDASIAISGVPEKLLDTVDRLDFSLTLCYARPTLILPRPTSGTETDSSS